MPEAAPNIVGPQARPEVNPSLMANVQMNPEAAGGGQTAAQGAQIGDQISQHLAGAIQLAVIRTNNASAQARAIAARDFQDQILHGDGTPEHPGFLNSPHPVQVAQWEAVNKAINDNNEKIAQSSPNPMVQQMVRNKLSDLTVETMARMHESFAKKTEEYADATQVQYENSLLKQTSTLGQNGADIATAGNNRAQLYDSILKWGSTKWGLTESGAPAPETANYLQKRMAEFDEYRVEGLLNGKHVDAAYDYLMHPQTQDSLGNVPGKREQLYDNVMKSMVRKDAYVESTNNINEIIAKNPQADLPTLKKLALANEDMVVYPKDEKYTDQYNSDIRTRTREYFDDRMAAQQAEQEDFTKNIFVEYSRNGSVPPPHVLDKYGLNEKMLAQGHPKVSDPIALNALKDMAAGFKDGQPKTSTMKDFMSENLYSDYYGRLNKSDFDKMADLQNKMRGKNFDPLNDPGIKEHKITTEIANEAMLAMTWDPKMASQGEKHWFSPNSPPNREMQFRNELDKRVQNWRDQNPNKPVGRQQVFEIASNLVVETVQKQQTAGLEPVTNRKQIPANFAVPKGMSDEDAVSYYNYYVGQNAGH